MKEITATEAKAHLADLLRSVESGETIAITRHGKAVAHLVPAHAVQHSAQRSALEHFETRRERWKPAQATLDEILAWRHEDHRY